MVRWLRLSAEQGHPRGQNGLGEAYEWGRGVPQDDREARKWYRLAADQGDGKALYNLGWMIEQGRGGAEADEQEAIRWYRLAAGAGSEEAQARLVLLGIIEP